MSKRVTLVLLLLMTVVLSGCTGAESQWVEVFIDTWITANGFATAVGGEVDLGKIVDMVFDRAVSEFVPSEEDTAIDAAASTIKDIEEADLLMKDAFSANNIDTIQKAQKLRPDDFTYQEAEAAIWMVKGNNAAAQNATNSSDLLVVNFVMQGGNCRSARLNQLQTRRNVLVQKLDDVVVIDTPAIQDSIYDEIGRVDGEIQSILAGEQNIFCAQIGADK